MQNLVFNPQKVWLEADGFPTIELDNTYYHFDFLNDDVIESDKRFIKERFTEQKNKDVTKESNRKFLTLLIETSCNLACSYCYVSANDFDKKKMPPELAIKMLSNILKDGDIPYVQFFGGEPTINPETIIAVSEYLYKRFKNPFMYITTNGCMPEEFLDKLLKYNIYFFISMDGLEEEHNLKRHFKNGRGSFDLALKTVRKVVKNGNRLKLRMTVTPESLVNLKESVKFFLDEGVKLFHIVPVDKIGRGNKNEKILSDFDKNFLDTLDEILVEAEKYNAKVMTFPFMHIMGDPRTYCKVIDNDNKFILTPDGYQSKCYGVQTNNHPFSKYFVTKKFENDTNEFSLLKDRESLLNHEYSKAKESCNSCFANYSCQGGCGLHNLQNNGEISKMEEEFCDKKKNLMYWALVKIVSRSKNIVNA